MIRQVPAIIAITILMLIHTYIF